jgi:hypothetical protein
MKGRLKYNKMSAAYQLVLQGEFLTETSVRYPQFGLHWCNDQTKELSKGQIQEVAKSCKNE